MKLYIDANKFIKDLQTTYGVNKDLVTIIKSLFFDCLAEPEKLHSVEAEQEPEQEIQPVKEEVPIPAPAYEPPKVVLESEVVRTQAPRSPLAKKLSAFVVSNEFSNMGTPKVDISR